MYSSTMLQNTSLTPVNHIYDGLQEAVRLGILEPEDARARQRAYMEAAWPLRNNIAMWQQYLKQGDAGLKSYVIPMQADHFENLPDAYIEPQQIDILRDEAIAYGEKLENAGVDVVLNLVEGSYHGFDADTENEFVQSIVSKRIDVMQTMLAVK